MSLLYRDRYFAGTVSVGTVSTSSTSILLVDGSARVGNLSLNTNYSGPAISEGDIRWDSTSGFPVIGLSGGSGLPIGGSNTLLVKNDTGLDLLKGKLVYVNGVSAGDILTVDEGISTDESKKNIIGVVTDGISIGSVGYITKFGLVSGIDTSIFSPGSKIYLSSVSGNFTEAKPDAPEHLVEIGYVVVADASNGSIFVNILPGYGIMDLYDVKDYVTASVATGSYLGWTPQHGYWEVYNPPSSVGTGTTNYVAVWTSSSQLGIGTIYDSGTAIGIATQSDGNYAVNVYGDVNINGTLYATSKSFDIQHPLDSSKRLTYGSLEGPEYGVYFRGKLTNENVINLPDYWTALVDENSITVDITPHGSYQRLFVDKIENNKVYVSVDNGGLPNCYYVVYAERKDISKIIVE